MRSAAQLKTEETDAPDLSLEALRARYGDLEGRDLLDVMIREVFPGRIALVSSFGSGIPTCERPSMKPA